MACKLLRRGVTVLATLGVACGGPAFAPEGDGGGTSEMDVSAQKLDSGGSAQDSGRGDAAHSSGQPDSGRADAGHPVDATTGDATTETGAADVVTRSDATGIDAAKGGDAGADAGHVDAGQDAGHDAGPECLTKTSSTSDGLYLVASTTAAIGACGSLATPCTDLASAISEAQGKNKHVIYVGGGTYSAASFSIPDGFTIQGGWDAAESNNLWTFTPTCTATATFAASGAVAMTIGSAATPSTAKITLDTIKIQNTHTAATGESVYGILASGTVGTSSLVLNDVDVTVTAGGAGADGADGTTGAGGIAGGCAEVGGGGVGTTGTANAKGTYGPSGYVGATPGVAGTGGTGSTPAPTASCTPTPEPTGCVIQTTCNVSTSAVACSQPTAGTNSACGGGGGTGGMSGGDGGGSFALYVWNETTSITDGSFASAAGGRGGTGGMGGAGGPAAPAGASLGTSTKYYSECVASHIGSTFTCTLGGQETIGPLAGAAGGPGGVGGAGGGGNGGDSYSYYVNVPTLVTVSGAPSFTYPVVQSQLGSGGTGTPPGPKGNLGNIGKTN